MESRLPNSKCPAPAGAAIPTAFSPCDARSRPGGRTRRTPGRRIRDAGLAYLTLLILVATIGMATVATVKLGALMQRRSAEQELLNIGKAFQAALKSYANLTPAGQPRSPQSLQDLLADNRFPEPIRHLRKVYIDPITVSNKWGILRTPDQQHIVGIYSLSTERPIKQANFDPELKDFQGAASYQDWHFAYLFELEQPQN